jgi:hypothetical protein
VKRSLPLILIGLALLLSAASPKPSPRPTQKPNESADLGNQQASHQPTPLDTSDLSNAPNGARTSTKEQDQGPDPSTIVIAISAVVSAIAAALIAWFNWQLVGVTDEMKNAAEAGLDVNRPFLLVTDVRCEEMKFADGIASYRFVVRLRNFGVGPADIATYLATVAIHDTPIGYVNDIQEPHPQYFTQNGQHLNDSLVAAGETIPDRIECHSTFDAPMFASILTHSKTIAVDGFVSYRGASPKTYVSKFFWWCYVNDAGEPTHFVRGFRRDRNEHT